jgi:membrane dipeptidase
MRAGGLDAAFFIVYVGQGLISPIGYEEAAAIAEEKYQAILRMIRAYPTRLRWRPPLTRWRRSTTRAGWWR